MWAKLLRVFQTRPTTRRKRATNRILPVLYDLETRPAPAST